uniref:Uncharacterized protein n=1 Tax=Hordeum vulgare subsp. vulgare TaxID=112509 RepID=A0A8I6YJS0_HORVV
MMESVGMQGVEGSDRQSVRPRLVKEIGEVLRGKSPGGSETSQILGRPFDRRGLLSPILSVFLQSLSIHVFQNPPRRTSGSKAPGI